MSQADNAQRMDALRTSGAGAVLAEFLKLRLSRKTDSLLGCTPTTFEAHKGRCLELKELINFIEGKRI